MHARDNEAQCIGTAQLGSRHEKNQKCMSFPRIPYTTKLIKQKEAMRHFKRSLAITPRAPIAHIEYGNGLYLLYGDDRIDEVSELYVKASETTALDAMERLDIEAALAELE